MNPVAPSAVVGDGQNLDAGDGVATGAAKGGKPGRPDNPGNGNGNGNGNGRQPSNSGPSPQLPANGSPGSPGQPNAPGLKKVEIEGLISAKGGDSITVNGQKVVVPSTCPIRHGSTAFTFADLHIGDRVHVRASKLMSDEAGSGSAITTLEATDVKLQNPGEIGEGDEPTNLVSVVATDAVAAETGGDTGTFTLTRSGNATLLAAPLSVSVTLAGTAVNGTDYANLPLTATFAAGSATTTVVVTPLADATTEGAETVVLALDVTTPYEVGSPASATVTISDTTAPLVSVTAFDSTAAEATLDPGVFRFTRSAVSATALIVTYTIGGSATSGADYQALSGTVTIPAGAAFADVTVTPVADADSLEGSETVIVTLVDAAAYDLGAPLSATVTVSP